METLIFFSIVAFTFIYAIVEAFHDFYVIRNEVGYTDDSKKWHLWGFLQNVLAFTPIFIGVLIWLPQSVLSIVMLVAFLFWQLHDTFLGILFYRRPFYLGNHGLDRHLDNIFNGGFNFFIVRAMIMTVWVFEYFRSY